MDDARKWNPPEIIWADHDYDRADGVCGLHVNEGNASGNPGHKGYEPLHYIRSDIVEEMVYDGHMTYAAHKQIRGDE